MITTARPNRHFPDLASPPDPRPDGLGRLAALVIAYGLACFGMGVFSGYIAKAEDVAVDTAAIAVQRICLPGQSCPTPAPAKSDAPAATFRLDPADGDPLPWETSVRIQVAEGTHYGTGSGTVIDGDPDRALILTCAHLFAKGKAYGPPGAFKSPVSVDLFDGNLKGGTVAFVETFPARVVDFDGKLDVGLVAIRPGRRLRSSPLVRDTFRPDRGLRLVSVGCSDGKAPTPWHHKLSGELAGNGYSAYRVTPKPVPGRSGGGLFTLDCKVIGVCNSADVGGPAGSYASPASIRTMLERNGRDDLAHPAETSREPELTPVDRAPHRPTPQAPTPQFTAPDPTPADAPWLPWGLDWSHFRTGLGVAGLAYAWSKLRGLVAPRVVRDSIDDLRKSSYEPPRPPRFADEPDPRRDPFDHILDQLGDALRAKAAADLAKAEREKQAAARAELIAKLQATAAPTSGPTDSPAR